MDTDVATSLVLLVFLALFFFKLFLRLREWLITPGEAVLSSGSGLPEQAPLLCDASRLDAWHCIPRL